MKKFLKKLVLFLLKRMAKFRLGRYKGKIITVTGSVGKTSTKEAIYTVLNTQFKVRKSKKSLNTDFGLVLTILDIESGYSSVVKWSWLLVKAFFNCMFRDYSEVLLLELGVDKPRDMDFLTSIVKPDVAVMTNIFPVHLADGQFKDLQQIFEEKKKLVDALKKDGVAVLNIDNPFLERLAKSRDPKNTITYGKSKEAMYFTGNITQTIKGISFTLHNKGRNIEVNSELLGEHQAYVLIPALICADIMKMDMEAAVTALTRYTLPPGRMSVIPARNNATILDSSYNSSPEALKAALKILKSLGEDRRKVAVLGNMNELGEESKLLHEMIGEVVPYFTDVLLTVGDEAKYIAKKAQEGGMKKELVHSFKSAVDAAEYFKDKIEKEDLVLVKGSQNNVRLEKFVKALMADPEQAKKLLVRQDKYWQSKE